MKGPNKQTDTFEDIYPKYPFSELVRLSLMLAGLINRRRTAIDQQDRPGRQDSQTDHRRYMSASEGR